MEEYLMIAENAIALRNSQLELPAENTLKMSLGLKLTIALPSGI